MAYSSLRAQKMTWTTFIAGPIYEFGVYRGASMVFLRRKPQFQNTFMYGFDSFEGFPDEAEGIGTQFDWTKGGYNGGDIRQELVAKLGGPSQVAFVKGFYQESLTPGLVKQLGMTPAAYIDMDASLYISSKQALTWVFENKLAIPRTLVGYNNWWVNSCSPGAKNLSPLETAEGKAHAEVSREFGVVFRCVAGGCRTSPSCQGFGAIFVVERILGKGMSGGDPGFHMNASEIERWKQSDQLCRYISRVSGKYSPPNATLGNPPP
jgi:hypothetical protein